MALFSCSDKDDISVSQDEIKSLSVSLGGIKTRASSPSDVVTADAPNVSSVLINLTDLNGKIITSKTVTKDEVLNSDWNKLTDPTKGLKFINTPQSVSKVYIYGNPGNAVNNNVVNTKLVNQQGSGVLYYGMDDDLKPIMNEPINPTPTSGKTYTAQVCGNYKSHRYKRSHTCRCGRSWAGLRSRTDPQWKASCVPESPVRPWKKSFLRHPALCDTFSPSSSLCSFFCHRQNYKNRLSRTS